MTRTNHGLATILSHQCSITRLYVPTHSHIGPSNIRPLANQHSHLGNPIGPFPFHNFLSFRVCHSSLSLFRPFPHSRTPHPVIPTQYLQIPLPPCVICPFHILYFPHAPNS